MIIPVFNEAGSVRALLEKVRTVPFSTQILIVDDGSTDGTTAEIARLAAPPQILTFFHPTNRGKGAAIRTALSHALGTYTIIQDADLEYDPQDYTALLQPLLDQQADVVYGSRYLQRKKRFDGRWRFDSGVQFLNLVVRLLYRARITDEATCYKMFSTSVLRAMNLDCERFEFCPEVTAKTFRMGLRFKEVSIRYVPRSIQAGKKIRLSDGIQALHTLWRYRNWVAPVAPVTPHGAGLPAHGPRELMGREEALGTR